MFTSSRQQFVQYSPLCIFFLKVIPNSFLICLLGLKHSFSCVACSPTLINISKVTLSWSLMTDTTSIFRIISAGLTKNTSSNAPNLVGFNVVCKNPMSQTMEFIIVCASPLLARLPCHSKNGKIKSPPITSSVFSSTKFVIISVKNCLF